MKHLFIVRHGDYYHNSEDNTYHLNDEGHRKMETLSELIKKQSNSSFYIVSSPENVAIESARVLADELGVSQPEEFLGLWCTHLTPPEGNRYADPNRVHKLILEREDKADTLIVVSHMEITDNYSRLLLRKELQLSDPVHQLEKGQAIHFDLEKKVYNLLLT